MNNPPVLPVNRVEMEQSPAHGIRGTTLVQICRTGRGFGLLAMILDYAPHNPLAGRTIENVLPKYKSGAFKPRSRSPHTLRLLKIFIGDLVPGLSPTVSLPL